MNCEILTFQFAHNYGAQLQCFALKKYLEAKGIAVSVSDFTPEFVGNAYGLWPGLQLRHPLFLASEILRSLRRYKQYHIFEDFINNNILNVSNKNIDYVIIGSYQVWNESITGRITEYYGTLYPNTKKIAYACSFGTNMLTDYQKQNVSEYLNDFIKVSLRESCNVTEVQKLISKEVYSVVDPVFLLGKAQWERFEKEVPHIPHDGYILYYALSRDEELIRAVKQEAEKNKCRVLAVHPICIKNKAGFRQLNNVGPREFLYLVKHARLIGTNSFHAVSFSEIYGKKVIYKAFSKNESRAPEIIISSGLRYADGIPMIYDLSAHDSSALEQRIAASKKFLDDALGLKNE